MRLVNRVRDKLISLHLERDLRAGRKFRGRQPESGSEGPITAKSEPLATVTMRVWREATQTWEDVT